MVYCLTIRLPNQTPSSRSGHLLGVSRGVRSNLATHKLAINALMKSNVNSSFASNSKPDLIEVRTYYVYISTHKSP